MSVIAAAACGVLTWTLLEYCIHRWLGHDRRFRRNLFGVEHTRHHAEGNYFAPTYKKLIVAAIVIGILTLPAIAVAGTAHGMAYVLGLVGFYGIYELLHRREHTHPGIGAYGRWARRHHFHHHFMNNRSNHGVTTPVWDFVFGTFERPTIIKVPPKLSMQWLIDPATGDVRAAHAARYQLTRSAR